MRQSTLLTFLLTLTISGCNRTFPEVKRLNEFQKTDFLPTLEHKISGDRNSIYCSTFLFAWDQVKQIIKTPLQIDSSLQELFLVNRSTSHIGTLREGEYSSTGQIDGDLITAKAEFKKSLPFEFQLASFDNELTFDGQKVVSFGTFDFDYETSNIIEILYYKDDNNFILKLLPKNKEHEIILYKTKTLFNSMADLVSDIDTKSEIGLRERENESLNWKYLLTEPDEVVIPKIEFNIETNYSALEGNKLKSGDINYRIETAWQWTAFILDEKGAEIESESVVSLSKSEEEEEDQKAKPKKMRFDKPFFLMLKSVESKKPYFGLWTANSELMSKE